MLERRVLVARRALPSTRSCRPSPTSRVALRAPCAIPRAPSSTRPCVAARRRPRTCPSCPRRRAVRLGPPRRARSSRPPRPPPCGTPPAATKTTVPAGTSASSSPTVNFARPRTTTYISSLPGVLRVRRDELAAGVASHALVPAAQAERVADRDRHCCPRTRPARSRPVHDVVRHASLPPQLFEDDRIDRVVAVQPLLEVLDARPLGAALS